MFACSVCGATFPRPAARLVGSVHDPELIDICPECKSTEVYLVEGSEDEEN